MDPVKLKIDGRASAAATAMVLFGTAVGTTVSYVGNKILQPAPQLEPGYHTLRHGLAEMALASVVLGVAGREAFRYLRNL
jgi:hypothetical protein